MKRVEVEATGLSQRELVKWHLGKLWRPLLVGDRVESKEKESESPQVVGVTRLQEQSRNRLSNEMYLQPASEIWFRSRSQALVLVIEVSRYAMSAKRAVAWSRLHAAVTAVCKSCLLSMNELAEFRQIEISLVVCVDDQELWCPATRLLLEAGKFPDAVLLSLQRALSASEKRLFDRRKPGRAQSMAAPNLERSVRAGLFALDRFFSYTPTAHTVVIFTDGNGAGSHLEPAATILCADLRARGTSVHCIDYSGRLSRPRNELWGYCPDWSSVFLLCHTSRGHVWTFDEDDTLLRLRGRADQLEPTFVSSKKNPNVLEAITHMEHTGNYADLYQSALSTQSSKFDRQLVPYANKSRAQTSAVKSIHNEPDASTTSPQIDSPTQGEQSINHKKSAMAKLGRSILWRASPLSFQHEASRLNSASELKYDKEQGKCVDFEFKYVHLSDIIALRATSIMDLEVFRFLEPPRPSNHANQSQAKIVAIWRLDLFSAVLKYIIEYTAQIEDCPPSRGDSTEEASEISRDSSDLTKCDTQIEVQHVSSDDTKDPLPPDNAHAVLSRRGSLKASIRIYGSKDTMKALQRLPNRSTVGDTVNYDYETMPHGTSFLISQSIPNRSEVARLADAAAELSRLDSLLEQVRGRVHDCINGKEINNPEVAERLLERLLGLCCSAACRERQVPFSDVSIHPYWFVLPNDDTRLDEALDSSLVAVRDDYGLGKAHQYVSYRRNEGNMTAVARLFAPSRSTRSSAVIVAVGERIDPTDSRICRVMVKVLVLEQEEITFDSDVSHAAEQHDMTPCQSDQSSAKATTKTTQCISPVFAIASLPRKVAASSILEAISSKLENVDKAAFMRVHHGDALLTRSANPWLSSALIKCPGTRFQSLLVAPQLVVEALAKNRRDLEMTLFSSQKGDPTRRFFGKDPVRSDRVLQSLIALVEEESEIYLEATIYLEPGGFSSSVARELDAFRVSLAKRDTRSIDALDALKRATTFSSTNIEPDAAGLEALFDSTTLRHRLALPTFSSIRDTIVHEVRSTARDKFTFALSPQFFCQPVDAERVLLLRLILEEQDIDIIELELVTSSAADIVGGNARSEPAYPHEDPRKKRKSMDKESSDTSVVNTLRDAILNEFRDRHHQLYARATLAAVDTVDISIRDTAIDYCFWQKNCIDIPTFEEMCTGESMVTALCRADAKIKWEREIEEAWRASGFSVDFFGPWPSTLEYLGKNDRAFYRARTSEPLLLATTNGSALHLGRAQAELSKGAKQVILDLRRRLVGASARHSLRLRAAEAQGVPSKMNDKTANSIGLALEALAEDPSPEAHSVRYCFDCRIDVVGLTPDDDKRLLDIFEIVLLCRDSWEVPPVKFASATSSIEARQFDTMVGHAMSRLRYQPLETGKKSESSGHQMTNAYLSLPESDSSGKRCVLIQISRADSVIATDAVTSTTQRDRPLNQRTPGVSVARAGPLSERAKRALEIQSKLRHKKSFLDDTKKNSSKDPRRAFRKEKLLADAGLVPLPVPGRNQRPTARNATIEPTAQEKFLGISLIARCVLYVATGVQRRSSKRSVQAENEDKPSTTQGTSEEECYAEQAERMNTNIDSDTPPSPPLNSPRSPYRFSPKAKSATKKAVSEDMYEEALEDEEVRATNEAIQCALSQVSRVASQLRLLMELAKTRSAHELLVPAGGGGANDMNVSPFSCPLLRKCSLRCPVNRFENGAYGAIAALLEAASSITQLLATPVVNRDNVICLLAEDHSKKPPRSACYARLVALDKTRLEMRIFGIHDLSAPAVDLLECRCQPALDRLALFRLREVFLDEFFRDDEIRCTGYSSSGDKSSGTLGALPPSDTDVDQISARRSLTRRLRQSAPTMCIHRLGSLPTNVADMELDTDDLALFINTHKLKASIERRKWQVKTMAPTTIPSALASISRCLLELSWGKDDESPCFYVARRVLFVAGSDKALSEQQSILFERDADESKENRIVVLISCTDSRQHRAQRAKASIPHNIGKEQLALVEVSLGCEDGSVSARCRAAVIVEEKSDALEKWITVRVQAGLDDACVLSASNDTDAAKALISSIAYPLCRKARLYINDDIVPKWTVPHLVRAARRDLGLHLRQINAAKIRSEATLEISVLDHSKDAKDGECVQLLAIWNIPGRLSSERCFAVLSVSAERRWLISYDALDIEQLVKRLSGTVKCVRNRQRDLEDRIAKALDASPGEECNVPLPAWWRKHSKEGELVRSSVWLPSVGVNLKDQYHASPEPENVVVSASVVVLRDAVVKQQTDEGSSYVDAASLSDTSGDEAWWSLARRRSPVDPCLVVGAKDAGAPEAALAHASAIALAFLITFGNHLYREYGPAMVSVIDSNGKTLGGACRFELAPQPVVVTLRTKIDGLGTLNANLTARRGVAHNSVIADPQMLEKWLKESAAAFRCRLLIALAKLAPERPISLTATAAKHLAMELPDLATELETCQTTCLINSSPAPLRHGNGQTKNPERMKGAGDKQSRNRYASAKPSSTPKFSDTFRLASRGKYLDLGRLDFEVALPAEHQVRKTSLPEPVELRRFSMDVADDDERSSLLEIESDEEEIDLKDAKEEIYLSSGLSLVEGSDSSKGNIETQPGFELVEYEFLQASPSYTKDATIDIALCIVTRVSYHEQRTRSQKVRVLAVASQSMSNAGDSQEGSTSKSALLGKEELLIEFATHAARRGEQRIHEQRNSSDSQRVVSRLAQLNINPKFLKAYKSFIVKEQLACWFPPLESFLLESRLGAWLLDDGDRKLKDLVGSRGRIVTSHEGSAVRRYSWLISLDTNVRTIFVVRLRIRVYQNTPRKSTRADVLAARAAGKPSPADDAKLEDFARKLMNAVNAHPLAYETLTAVESATINDVDTRRTIDSTGMNSAKHQRASNILASTPHPLSPARFHDETMENDGVSHSSIAPLTSLDVHDKLNQLELDDLHFRALSQHPPISTKSPLSPTRARRNKKGRAAAPSRQYRGNERGRTRPQNTLCCSFCSLWGGVWGGAIPGTRSNSMSSSSSKHQHEHTTPRSPYFASSATVSTGVRTSPAANITSFSPPQRRNKTRAVSYELF